MEMQNCEVTNDFLIPQAPTLAPDVNNASFSVSCGNVNNAPVAENEPLTSSAPDQRRLLVIRR